MDCYAAKEVCFFGFLRAVLCSKCFDWDSERYNQAFVGSYPRQGRGRREAREAREARGNASWWECAKGGKSVAGCGGGDVRISWTSLAVLWDTILQRFDCCSSGCLVHVLLLCQVLGKTVCTVCRTGYS